MATDEGTDSEPALKQIPNLKNFPNQHGKSGTKTHYGNAEIAASFANSCFHPQPLSDDDDDDKKSDSPKTPT